jgi:pyrimidine deaminase RibD-like protein/NTP pyrophosphatase (non-canonical NTP hydrolase)
MNPQTRELIERAIAEEKLSKAEDGRPHPKVGAVILNGNQITAAHRGELSAGDHAEFTLFERKLVDADLADAILVTTLEPCTTRNHPKTPCALRAVARRVRKVYVGMLDPNPDIYGQGLLALKKNGIEVELFPFEFAQQVRADNDAFIRSFQNPVSGDPRTRRLDEWYFSVNSIYFDSNFYRAASSVFTHLVEVMGGLSLLATDKVKPDVDADTYLAKALAWWLALCGKLGVRSVDDLLWSKFPFVCPYCHKCPHNDDLCREAKRRSRNPDWDKLGEIAAGSIDRRPTSISAWQKMYAQIFPVSQTEKYEMVFGRFTEELGELAEAIRIGTVAPGYVISEAADVFAWLMKLINIREKQLPASQRGQKLEQSMWDQYPNKCRECGNPVCNCPPLLPKTLGRIAHEGPDARILQSSGAFMSPSETAAFFEVGSKQLVIGGERISVTQSVVSGVRAVADRLLQFSKGIEKPHPEVANQLLAVSQSLNATTVRELVNDRDVQNLLRSYGVMSPDLREQLIAQTLIGDDEFENAVRAYIRKL